MSSYLEIRCNYDCGKTVCVDIDDWLHLPRDENGDIYRWAMYEHVGKRVLTALIDHHLSDCTEYYKQPDGKPWLRLVQS